MPQKRQLKPSLQEEREENLKDIIIRTAKVYLFVMALVFLGRGFKPIVEAYISRLPYQGLYWLNMISAIVDNATLTAAEIAPGMSLLQIKSALMGLLLAGGMLIPGNIPNIISAGKLKIKSSEWARFGLPLGLLAMTGYFFLLMLIK
jgi:predicted cation transporter